MKDFKVGDIIQYLKVFDGYMRTELYGQKAIIVKVLSNYNYSIKVLTGKMKGDERISSPRFWMKEPLMNRNGANL